STRRSASATTTRCSWSTAAATPSTRLPGRSTAPSRATSAAPTAAAGSRRRPLPRSAPPTTAAGARRTRRPPGRPTRHPPPPVGHLLGGGGALTSGCTPEAPSGAGGNPGGTLAWPGGLDVTIADNVCAFKTSTGPEGRDVSSLVFDPNTPSTLWAVKNKNWL